jgi:hypothetical protein
MIGRYRTRAVLTLAQCSIWDHIEAIQNLWLLELKMIARLDLIEKNLLLRQVNLRLMLLLVFKVKLLRTNTLRLLMSEGLIQKAIIV